MLNKEYPGVLVDSIDGSQGKEKELIIFSAVRSNRHGSVGFLKDRRRMNVMLTRARRGLIVFGNLATLQREEGLWTQWANWVCSNNACMAQADWYRMMSDKAHIEVPLAPQRIADREEKERILKMKAEAMELRRQADETRRVQEALKAEEALAVKEGHGADLELDSDADNDADTEEQKSEPGDSGPLAENAHADLLGALADGAPQTSTTTDATRRTTGAQPENDARKVEKNDIKEKKEKKEGLEDKRPSRSRSPRRE